MKITGNEMKIQKDLPIEYPGEHLFSQYYAS